MIALKPMVAVLSAMLREHEALLDAAKRKKTALIGNDNAGLNGIVKQEVEHLHRIEKLEGERQGMSKLLAARLGLPVPELTVTKMSAIAGTPEEREEILRLSNALTAVIGELKERNELNKQLIEQSLDFVRGSIELLTESPQVPTYGDTGDTHAAYGNKRTSFFDSKA